MSEILEEYAIIKGNENYAVSNTGKVLNIKSQKHLNQRESENGYMKVHIQDKEYKVHRLMAMAYLNNLENKPVVDHIDGNRVNNIITNLRWATKSENSRNSKISSTNTSGIKGVRIENGRWRVQIRINGKNKHIGYYNTIEEATLARKYAVKEHYGEFVNENEKLDENDLQKEKPKTEIERESKSGHKNIYIENGKYRVQLTVNGRRKNVGYYERIEEAIKARDEVLLREG